MEGVTICHTKYAQVGDEYQWECICSIAYISNRGVPIYQIIHILYILDLLGVFLTVK